MTADTFVDTNILIYAYDLDAGDKHDRARELIRSLWESGNGVLSTQVLQEFYVKVTQKIPTPLPYARARQVVEQYAHWQVETITPQTILRASELHERHQLSFWDALILSAAQQAGTETLLTEDLNHGQVVEGIRIENPFLAEH